MSHSITVTEVTKSYGSRTILNQVSLAIGEGETVALLGPSGGGKSTLLRCMNGLNPFDRGTIEVGKWRLTPDASADTLSGVRRSLGMIFQDFQLFPHMTALENVMEGPVAVQGKSVAEAREQALLLLQSLQPLLQLEKLLNNQPPLSNLSLNVHRNTDQRMFAH